MYSLQCLQKAKAFWGPVQTPDLWAMSVLLLELAGFSPVSTLCLPLLPAVLLWDAEGLLPPGKHLPQVKEEMWKGGNSAWGIFAL